MCLVMRLRQQGCKNKRMFRMVVTDRKNRRDGKYIESVGYYNPHVEDGCVVHKDRVDHWLSLGAQPTEKMKALLKRKSPESLQILAKKK